MKFFTDKTVKNDYLLVKIKDYRKMNDFTQWKEVFIDPGVYELRKQPYYSWEDSFNLIEFLKTLPKTHYFSFDYPPDMNLYYQEEFINETWYHSIKFHNYPQYIVTCQYKFNNYWDFVNWFDKFNSLKIKSGILALGNMCRIITKSQFIYHALDYAFSHSNHPRMHIYGLSIRFIPYAYKLSKKYGIELSIDSTKWTRILRKYRIPNTPFQARTNEERQLFFNLYLEEIINRGVKLENEK